MSYAPHVEGQPTAESSSAELIAFVRDTLQNGSNPTRGNLAFDFLEPRVSATVPWYCSRCGTDCGRHAPATSDVAPGGA